MKSRFNYLVGMFAWCVTFALIGALCASLVPVVSKDGMTVNKLIRLGRKLSDATEHVKVIPTSIEELASKGICCKQDCRDAWGVPFTIKSCEGGTISIISHGEPGIQKQFPDVKVSIIGDISFDKEAK